ncbi:MAG: hypothetical protein ABI592_15170 [Acidobacteriota bacterium]
MRDAAQASGIRVALVGGAVRDRLLDRPNPARDADVAVEGDAAELARSIAGADPGVDVRIHDRFGTATISTPSGWRIDLASTRRETYERPGALPSVRPAALEEDLDRRDFTVNAMAWELAPPGFRERRFLDPLGGAEDIRGRKIRALHPGSFRDDPTRALRAVRYANRLGFRVEPATRRWIAEALVAGALDTISGDRLRREVEKIFWEDGAARAVRLAGALGIPRAIDPDLDAGPGAIRALGRAERLARGVEPKATWLLPLLVWTDGLPERARTAVANRLSLSGPSRKIFERWPETRDALLSGRGGRSRCGADERLAAAAVWPAGSGGAAARARLLAPEPRLSIRGSDLLRAGIAAGPSVGRALAETRLALEDGRIRRAQELPYAIAVALREDS